MQGLSLRWRRDNQSSSDRPWTIVSLRAAATIAVLAALALPQSVAAQPTVAPGWDTEAWLPRATELRLELDRSPLPAEGRLAVTIGATDVSDLFRRDGEALVYRPTLLPLPVGESEVVVHFVAPGNRWVELDRFPLRVLSKGGFRSSSFGPRLDVESEALLDEDEAQGSGEETGFREWTGQLGLQGGFERRRWLFQGDLGVVGVTDRSRALRFFEAGEDADKVDLSSWRARFERDRGFVQLGHLSFGDSRHLIDGFASRGIAVGTPVGGWGELRLGAFNGTSIVGWDNILGLRNGDHQVLSLGFGAELQPQRPGALRLDVALLDGSLEGLSDFNQGDINDREESRGWSFRLRGTAARDRVRFDAGFAESEFTNPFDPDLAQGSPLVPVREERRNARYLDVDATLWQRTTPTNRLHSIGLGGRYERVDPLYRSVGTFVQPDLEQIALDLAGTFGAVTAQVSLSDSRDNLDRIPSILTTNTDRRALSLSVPLPEMVSDPERPNPWIPALSYSLDRTHQYGESVPDDSGFAPTHVPDQVSLNHNTSLQWRGTRWTVGYVFGYTDQDNRQLGRELADFTSDLHLFTIGLTPDRLLELTFDLSLERGRNKEREEELQTRRYGMAFTSPLREWASLTGSISKSESETVPLDVTNDATVWDLQSSFRLYDTQGERHGLSLQLYLRYAYQQSEIRDPVFGLDQDLSFWSINSGINLSLF